jgi:hypothetical protein
MNGTRSTTTTPEVKEGGQGLEHVTVCVTASPPATGRRHRVLCESGDSIRHDTR